MRIWPRPICVLTLIFVSACTANTPGSINDLKNQCRNDTLRNCFLVSEARRARGIIQAYPDPAQMCHEYARKSCD